MGVESVLIWSGDCIESAGGLLEAIALRKALPRHWVPACAGTTGLGGGDCHYHLFTVILRERGGSNCARARFNVPALKGAAAPLDSRLRGNDGGC